MISNWEAEELADRLKRFDSFFRLGAESTGLRYGMSSKLAQLEVSLERVPKRPAQMLAEANTHLKVLEIKAYAALAGVLVGATAVWFLCFAAFKQRLRARR